MKIIKNNCFNKQNRNNFSNYGTTPPVMNGILENVFNFVNPMEQHSWSLIRKQINDSKDLLIRKKKAEPILKGRNKQKDFLKDFLPSLLCCFFICSFSTRFCLQIKNLIIIILFDCWFDSSLVSEKVSFLSIDYINITNQLVVLFCPRSFHIKLMIFIINKDSKFFNLIFITFYVHEKVFPLNTSSA